MIHLALNGDCPAPAWMSKAACVQAANPDMFFPAPGDEAGEAEAKAVCGGCRVRSECFAYAITRGIDDGVWGGASEDERRAIRMQRYRATAAVNGHGYLEGPGVMTGAQNPPSRVVSGEGCARAVAGPATCRHGFSGSPAGQQARFTELTDRRLMARAIAKLRPEGTYDPQQHGQASDYQPLTVAEHLERLALGEQIARYYRHPANVHEAVMAGASWEQIAVAIDAADPRQVRLDYQRWAERQHWLYQQMGGAAGLNPTEYAAAIARATQEAAP